MNRALVGFAMVLPLIHVAGAFAQVQYGNGLRGGGSLDVDVPCVTPLDRAALRRAIGVNRAALGLTGGDAGPHGGALPLLPFYPIGGNGYRDIFHGGFVDLDPGPGFHDYNCMPFTRDTHAGIDSEIRSFGEQVIGVPVLAALDGMVVFAQDGWPDMNLNGGVQGNIVAIDHGGGWESSYWHLKNGSVSVSVGQQVRAGEQIGMIASSGNSFGPHLHFEIRDPSFEPYEPFAGACRPGPSGWVDQPPTNLESFLDDFAMSYIPLDTVPGLPHEMPRTGQIGFEDPEVWLWVRGHNLQVQSSWRVQFFRPDDSEALLWEWFFFNDELFRNYWFTFGFDIEDLIPDMHVITGTWRVRVEFNDELMVDAPFEVREMRTPDFNRPPEPIGVAFDPPSPTAQDVIFCRVDTSLLLDDPDFDIVRYRYQWTVDGTVVRDVVTAGQADAIAHSTACPGAVVSCMVTPHDGQVDGPPAMVQATLPGVAMIDLDCDCVLTPADVPLFVAALVAPETYAGCSIDRADVNDDTQVDALDIAGFIDALIP